ncbi:MAG: hypothetical protein K2X94_00740 [Amoebophilaceae bacterium]|nr:hypothetical protein [Amoebophilaceae bacterium]
MDYGNLLKINGNIAGYQLMNQPITMHNGVITIALINPIQEDTLQSIREDLIIALRKEFNDADHFTIQTTLTEQSSDKKPYTDQEKLNHLSEKNSAVALLRERLLLEVAY